MARFTGCMLLLLASVYIWCIPNEVKAELTASIQLEGVKLDVKEAATIRQPITNTPIEMLGSEQEVTLYYELHSNAIGDKNELVLNMEYSELLIAPSSITVSVDGQKGTSKSLGGEQLSEQISIPLTDAALEKGVHSVTVSFYGVIKEGICIDQETSGNWLTINTDSYFQLNGLLSEGKQSLVDYPNMFLGTNENPVLFVIPDSPSMSTLNKGLTIAAYLAEQSQEDEAVKIIRESDVETITGNIIFFGAQTEFTTSFMKDLLRKTMLPANDQSLILSHHEIADGDQKVEGLIITATTPKDLEKRSGILTDVQFTKQFSGSQMTIDEIPDSTEVYDKRIIPLRKFGMENLKLDHYEGESQNYYHYVSTGFSKDKSVLLELNLKRSETITSKKEQGINELLNRDVELVVLVNDVPHSIDIRKLADDINGVYTVNLSIDASTIGDNHMMHLQFLSSGLKQKNPCISTNENHWIYISEDSFFKFSNEIHSINSNLASFPSPFIGEEIETTIIVPNDIRVEDNQLLYLYRSLMTSGNVPNLALKYAKDVKAQAISNQHVIFIGGPDVQPLLKEVQEDLIVPYEKGAVNLSSFGFITEVTEIFSWIQPNPWSKGKYELLVFDRTDESKSYMDRDFLEFLKNMNEVATIAVKMNNKELYTNANYLEEVTGDVKGVEPIYNEFTWLVLGFVGLLLLMTGLILFKLRKRK